jgi:hypothetical protein
MNLKCHRARMLLQIAKNQPARPYACQRKYVFYVNI